MRAQIAFIERHVVDFLRPIAGAHFRWSYQHNKCRDRAFAVLCANKSFSGHMPPYVVLEILEWTNDEYVLRSTHTQRINLIIGVAASIRRVRAARASMMS